MGEEAEVEQTTEQYIKELIDRKGTQEGAFTNKELYNLKLFYESYQELKQYYTEQNEVNKRYILKEDVIYQVLDFIRELKHDNLYSDSGLEARDTAIQFLMDFIVKLL